MGAPTVVVKSDLGSSVVVEDVAVPAEVLQFHLRGDGEGAEAPPAAAQPSTVWPPDWARAGAASQNGQEGRRQSGDGVKGVKVRSVSGCES